MSTITKELLKDKREATRIHTESDVVKEVLLLEQESAAEDMRIARGLGRHNSLSVGLDQKGKFLEMEKLDEKYYGNVFTLAQIKKLARKYNMRFLQTRAYCGKMDTTVIAKLKEFAKKTDTVITDGALEHNYFILAPEQCFQLKTEFIERFPDPDPALFYKIDEGHYRMIHQWGKDFNISQRISGLLKQDFGTRFGVILGFLLLLLTGLFLATGNWKVLAMGGPIVLLVSLLFGVGPLAPPNGDMHENKWNSDVKTKYGSTTQARNR